MEINGVILAAGFSSRASGFKMGYTLGGKTFIERNIDAMKNICSNVIVVGGYKIEKLKELVGKKAKVVCNNNYINGMFSSIKKGIDKTCCDVLFIVPGDYPLISEGIYTQMLGAFDAFGPDNDIIVPAFQGEKGHPVLIRGCLIKDILTLPDSYNLRDFLESKGYISIDINDKGIILDVDSLEDYEKIKKIYKERMQ